MEKFEIIRGVASKCESIQITDGMPAVRCLIGNKAVTIISAGLVPGIFDGDEVSVALVDIPRMGGRFGAAYYNITRDQEYRLPTKQFRFMGWLFSIVGLATVLIFVGIFFLYQGIKTIRLANTIDSGANALRTKGSA